MPQESKGVIDITVVGDVMPGRKVAESLHCSQMGESGARLRSLLAGEIAVGNLECPLCQSTPAAAVKPDGGPNLRADPSMAHWLRKAGFDILSLANNHAMDCGAAGLVETLDALSEAGIVTVGAGRTYAQAVAPALVASRGKSIAILAFGNGVAAGAASPGVAPFTSVALRDGLAAVPPGVATTVVLMHWGIEFLEYPEPWAVQFADQALRRGADVVIGGHSHCLRGVADTPNGVVVYGVGDFLMDTADPQLLEAHLARTAMTKLGFVVADPLICRSGLAVDLLLKDAGGFEMHLRPIVLDEEFLPCSPDEAETAELLERIRALSAPLLDTGRPEALRTARIWKAYKKEYFGGSVWRDFVRWPLRIVRRLGRTWRTLL